MLAWYGSAGASQGANSAAATIASSSSALTSVTGSRSSCRATPCQ